MSSSSSKIVPPSDVLDIVKTVKSNGTFDSFRREIMSELDDKSSYQNLKKRFENLVQDFLAGQKWNPMLKKTDIREGLRKTIDRSGILKSGMDKVIDQIVSAKIESTFRPAIAKLVGSSQNYAGMDNSGIRYRPKICLKTVRILIIYFQVYEQNAYERKTNNLPCRQSTIEDSFNDKIRANPTDEAHQHQDITNVEEKIEIEDKHPETASQPAIHEIKIEKTELVSNPNENTLATSDVVKSEPKESREKRKLSADNQAKKNKKLKAVADEPNKSDLKPNQSMTTAITKHEQSTTTTTTPSTVMDLSLLIKPKESKIEKSTKTIEVHGSSSKKKLNSTMAVNTDESKTVRKIKKSTKPIDENLASGAKKIPSGLLIRLLPSDTQPLKADPKNEYNFDWKIESENGDHMKIFDDMSDISSGDDARPSRTSDSVQAHLETDKNIDDTDATHDKQGDNQPSNPSQSFTDKTVVLTRSKRNNRKTK